MLVSLIDKLDEILDKFVHIKQRFNYFKQKINKIDDKISESYYLTYENNLIKVSIILYINAYNINLFKQR